MREIWKAIAHTSGAKIYSLLSSLVTLSLTARWLGPEGRGQFATITTLVGIFGILFSLSLGQVALHRMTHERENIQAGRIFGCLAFMAIIFSITGWATVSTLYIFNNKEILKGLAGPVITLAFIGLPFMIWEQYGSSLLIALGKVHTYNLYQVLGKTISLILLVILVGIAGLGVKGAISANLVGQILLSAGGISFIISYASSRNQKIIICKKEIYKLTKGGIKLHLNAIGTFLFTSVNVLIINYYYGSEQAGYFQLSLQLICVMMIIPQSASIIIFGKMAKVGPDKAWPENKKLLLQVSIVMVFLSIIAAVSAPIIVEILAGAAFKPAVEPFQLMLIAMIGITFSAIIGPQWIGRGYFWQASLLTFGLGIINIVLNVYLIKKYGMYGATYAFIGTYIFSVLGNGVMAIKCNNLFKLNENIS